MPTLHVDIAHDAPTSNASRDPAQIVTAQLFGEPAPLASIDLDGGVGDFLLAVGYYWIHRFGESKLVHLTADADLDALPNLDPATLDPAAEPAAAWDARADELEERIEDLEAAGPGGGGTGIEYTQSTPLASWLVPHTFGRLPNVAVYIAGEEVDADVTATTTQAVIAFASPAAGVAVLT